jgi:hypothetical protein
MEELFVGESAVVGLLEIDALSQYDADKICPPWMKEKGRLQKFQVGKDFLTSMLAWWLSERKIFCSGGMGQWWSTS